MKSFYNEWMPVVIGFVGVIVVIVTLIAGVRWLVHDPYRMSGVYCDVNGKNCAYRNKTVNSKDCPEFWDHSSAWGPVNNLKLKQGTCKVEAN
jgi:hypothetical protein